MVCTGLFVDCSPNTITTCPTPRLLLLLLFLQRQRTRTTASLHHHRQIVLPLLYFLPQPILISRQSRCHHSRGGFKRILLFLPFPMRSLRLLPFPQWGIAPLLPSFPLEEEVVRHVLPHSLNFGPLLPVCTH